MNTDTALATAVIHALGTVMDPEFGISITDLGLIYSVDVEPERLRVAMTLTTMYCPSGQVLFDGARTAAESASDGRPVEVEMVWDPAWTPDCITPAGRAALGCTDPGEEH
ncbi:metal-sulfur cluster assembly factor [Actomonas aquatica]|uniref:Metal-sulfur cluster assembly factor n=1 Tax=Actomonas aquatica TaxID=2866162 RepID=A0ABZ1C899_9BACT|nr:metal-sulfur cluster assembly factor [Opitutus sp. WL0086]WRQ86535.1 metal-sulfur cluster assembly factor [Opitutus sp. WL0086]